MYVGITLNMSQLQRMPLEKCTCTLTEYTGGGGMKEIREGDRKKGTNRDRQRDI